MAVRNMYRIEINIHEKRIVRQVGYLQKKMLGQLHGLSLSYVSTIRYNIF